MFFSLSHNSKAQTQVTHFFLNYFEDFGIYACIYMTYVWDIMHVSFLVNINIFEMTPQRATWKNSYYMLNVLPSLNKVLLLLLLLLLLFPGIWSRFGFQLSMNVHRDTLLLVCWKCISSLVFYIPCVWLADMMSYVTVDDISVILLTVHRCAGDWRRSFTGSTVVYA